MRAVVAWWDLDRSDQTIESLRDFLRDEAVDRFSAMPGLRLKFWISDQESNRWGAVFLWESAEAAAQPLPPRAAELIGYPPAQVASFDVEAVVEGDHHMPDLVGRGLALKA